VALRRMSSFRILRSTNPACVTERTASRDGLMATAAADVVANAIFLICMTPKQLLNAVEIYLRRAGETAAVSSQELSRDKKHTAVAFRTQWRPQTANIARAFR